MAVMVATLLAALREGAFLGTPAVTVGTRQTDSRDGRHVLGVGYDRDAIAASLARADQHGRYEPRRALRGRDGGRAGSPRSSRASEPKVQKRLHYYVAALETASPLA